MRMQWVVDHHIAIVVIAAVVSGLAFVFVEAVSRQEERAVQTGSIDIERMVDHEAGVACWIYRGGFGAGISCLPLAETNLEAVEAAGR